MPSLPTAVLIGLFLAASIPSAAVADQKIVVQAPADARVTVALTGPAEGDLPPLLTIFVSPQPDYRALWRNRALFQRWTGFRRQYSGRRYPF